MLAPFGPESRTGLELELLAPAGSSRFALAEALSAELGGRVEYGLKVHGGGPHDDGRRIYRLSPAARVVDDDGQVLLSFVDDVTLREDLARDERTGAGGSFRAVMDDVRLAAHVERFAWGEALTPEAVLAPILESWPAALGHPGAWGAKHPAHRALVDPYGHVLGVVCEPEPERERVCEVVTRPLSRGERFEVAGRVLETAERLGFSIPREAALHVHVDAAPWRSAASLSALMRCLNERREDLFETFETNPACRKLAPFDDALMAVAREVLEHVERAGVEPDFEDFASELRFIGVQKYTDVNLQGVVNRFPKQPTLEVRFLSMSLDARKVAARVEQVEGVLLAQWERGQALLACR